MRTVVSIWVLITMVLAVSSGGPAQAGEDSEAASKQVGYRLHAAPKPLSPAAKTNDWTSFLGPHHNGIADETKLLKDFSDGGPALVWEVESGTGYSSIAIAENRLILFSRVFDEEVVDCLDAETGLRLWRFSYAVEYSDKYGFNSGPRASPIISNGAVYTYGVQGKLNCLNLKTGALVWVRDLNADFDVPSNYFGVGSTPLGDGDRLIINVGGKGGPSVVSLDKRTGKTVWETRGENWGASYATPVPATIHSQRCVFVFAGGRIDPPTGGLLGIDPKDGSVRYKFPFRGKRFESVNASSPVTIGNSVFVTTSYGTGGAMLKLGSDGSCKPMWTNKELECHFATPIHRDGFLYGLDGSGRGAALVCVEASSGRLAWQESPTWAETREVNGKPREVEIGLGLASLIVADSHFLCLSDSGRLLWLDLSPQGYQEIAKTRLFDAKETWTPPVISRGLLYIKQNTKDASTKAPSRLICYDLRAPR